jgi:dihydropteroate synthase
MGILNITPDSFSGDGVMGADAGAFALVDTACTELVEVAVAQAQQMVHDGADIIDIGGESTRPHSQPITTAEEMARVLPIIMAVREAVDVPISVDTYRAETARAALAAGADWVNDIWGLQADAAMAQVVAEADCPVVIMHNGRNHPRVEDEGDKYYGRFHYHHLINEMKEELCASIELAMTQGVKKERIILDPGIGFGKNAEQNLEILRHLSQFKAMGHPLLLGTSRKGFIGKYSGNLPANERVEGTAATVALGIAQGADIVRVHDVKEMVRVARMTDAIVRLPIND